MISRILVPLDGSVFAEAAVSHACDLARCGNGEILLMRVVSYPLRDLALSDPLMSGSLGEDLLKLRFRAEEYLESVAARLRQAGFSIRTIVVDDDSAADAILDQSQTERADVIVMSTHGRGGVSRWLLGSVADRVVKHATVPVLLVRVFPPPTPPIRLDKRDFVGRTA